MEEPWGRIGLDNLKLQLGHVHVTANLAISAWLIVSSSSNRKPHPGRIENRKRVVGGGGWWVVGGVGGWWVVGGGGGEIAECMSCLGKTGIKSATCWAICMVTAV